MIAQIIKFWNKHYLDIFKGFGWGLLSGLYTQYIFPYLSYSMQQLFWIIVFFIIACGFRIKIAFYPQKVKGKLATDWFFFRIFIILAVNLLVWYVFTDYIALYWI
jgi:hypothetical protein